MSAPSVAYARNRRSNQEAAERCGLHRTYYSGVERGVRNVSLVNIEKVAKGLWKSLPDLFNRMRAGIFVSAPAQYCRLTFAR